MDVLPFPWRIQIATAILCIAEAWLEVIVIRLKNPASGDYVWLNRQEHTRSAIHYGAMVLLYFVVSWDFHQWYLLLALLVIERRIFFEVTLKIFRKRQVRFIDGDQYWDNLSRKIFGYKGGWWELLVLITLAVAGNYLI